MSSILLAVLIVYGCIVIKCIMKEYINKKNCVNYKGYRQLATHAEIIPITKLCLIFDVNFFRTLCKKKHVGLLLGSMG